MISQTIEYALRAAVYLASKPDQPQTAEDIAKVTLVPRPYLSKVMQGLARADIVRSQRGRHGGFVLATPANKMTVYDVVQAVDPIKRITTCPLGLESHGVHLCPLHRRLDAALGSVEAVFRRTTLAEVIEEPNSSVPLCDFPVAMVEAANGRTKARKKTKVRRNGAIK